MDNTDQRKHTGGGNTKGTRRGFGYLRKLPSKRWHASYLAPDGSGRRINAPTTFETKKDASGWLSTEQAAITERRWRPPAPKREATLFGDYARDWLTRRELKPRTRDEYGRLLDKLEPTFGDKPLAAIDAAMVRSWYATLDPAKPTQRSHLYSVLRSIMGTAVEEDLLAASPVHVRGAGRVKRARQIRPATLDELTAIVEAMPERWRLMIDLAAWTSLRFGELTELRRSDVDLTARVIRVRRGVTWIEGQPVVGDPKTEAGARDVAIPPHLVPVVAEHLLKHAQPGRDGLLFASVAGNRHLSHGTFYKHFRAARKTAGREDLRLHDLRHTGAVMAAVAGATVRELQDRLGHTTAEMAMRYQHVADGRQDEIARRLSAMAEGATQ